MSYVQRLIFTACAAVGFACHAAAPVTPVGAAPQPQVAPAPLVQIELGDQVKVDVFANADLAGVAEVADDGTIRLPLLGDIQVRGLSLTEAAKKIEAALKAGQILVDPHVTVSVPQPFRLFVTVTGETGIQGRISIQPNSTLLDVIALAGGLTARASDTVYILRKDASGAIQRTAVHLDMREVVSSGSASSPALQTLQGGDTIVVPKGTFTIVGNISNRGEYRVETGMMVFQAIARAGGVTATGSERRITIRRVRPDGKIVDIKAKKDTRIEPDDLITVGERWF